MNERYVDWVPFDIGACIATESITISLYATVSEDGVERRRETGTEQLDGYHIQSDTGGAMLGPGGLRKMLAPTLFGPDTNLIQVGTEIEQDNTGERFRVNKVDHEMEWLVATLDNIV